MFWIFLLFIALMILGCYVTYKEAKHHELHKMRACFIDLKEKAERLKKNQEVRDPEHADVFQGEIRGLEEVLAEIDREDADCDLIQEINEDLEKIKEKIENLFKK